MPELLTRADYYQIGRQYVLTRAKRIEPAQVDVEGSDINVFIGSQSFCAHAVSRQLGSRINALLLDGAEDEDLDRYAFDRYVLTRKGASAALGEVQFSRATYAAGSGQVPVGQKLRTLTGVEYITITAAVFSATAVTATAFVRAVQAGHDYQVGRNNIRTIVGLASLWDTTLTVNNDAPTAGGGPREDNDVFRERIRNFWTTARRGTLAAIQFGALAVPGVTSSTAVEVVDQNGHPARLVELFIADESGVASLALAAATDVELDEWRAAGIRVLTSLSTPQIISVQLSLTFRAGVDTVTLTEQIRSAVVTFINSLPVGGTLVRGELGAVLVRFKPSGLLPDEDSVVSPTGDLVPDSGKTLRTTLSRVTVS